MLGGSTFSLCFFGFLWDLFYNCVMDLKGIILSYSALVNGLYSGPVPDVSRL